MIVKPYSPNLGAVIKGVDLSRHISDTELNVSSLNEGVYMVQVTQNDATATRKLIIK